MPLRFGSFTLDLDQRRLLGASVEIPLTPKAFELLRLLVDHRPKALSKQEILHAIWKDTFVTENNLATTIRDLREALGDDAKEPRFIRTAYAYGYAFVGEVSSAPALPVGTATLVSPWRLIHAYREIPLHAGENVVGRSGADVIVIDSPTVSRHHAKLTIEGRQLFCEDLGSKNGTWVGTQAAEERLEVQDGDEIRLGSVVVIARIETHSRTTETVERHRG
jgi:DNA-binding winged helix-turn-helix (wHTH) protein